MAADDGTGPAIARTRVQNVIAVSGFAYGVVGADIHVFGNGLPLYLLANWSARLKADPEWLRELPSRMLNARREVVPFTGRDGDLARLRAWGTAARGSRSGGCTARAVRVRRGWLASFQPNQRTRAGRSSPLITVLTLTGRRLDVVSAEGARERLHGGVVGIDDDLVEGCFFDGSRRGISFYSAWTPSIRE